MEYVRRKRVLTVNIKNQIVGCIDVIIIGVLMYGMAFVLLGAYLLFFVPMAYSEKFSNYFEKAVNYITIQICYLIDGRPLIPQDRL